jgi:general secretion pathway protein L
MPSVDPGIARDALGSTVIAGALRWWLDALAELGRDLGAALRLGTAAGLTVELTDRGWVVARESGASRAVLGTIDADRLDDDALRRTVRRLLRRDQSEPVALLLPAGAVLTRIVRLPAAAAADLASILDFEIARHTPFTAERAYYRHRVLGGTTAVGTIEIELDVVPRDLVDATLRRLAVAGLAAESVSAVDMPPRERRRRSLMPVSARPATGDNRLQRGLAIAAVAALGLAVVSPIAAAQLRLALVERDIAALQSVSDRVLAAREHELRAGAALDALLAAKRAAPSVVETLLALTRALPDGSFLSSLQLAGRELIIEGASPSAAALARPLETIGPFARVGYRAPVTRDPRSGLEQFQFGITLAERAP